MPDIAAPVYPSYKPDSGNALASDPAKVVGLISGIQDYRLKNQQFDALSQQPAAALQGQNIANSTAQNKQNEEAAQIVAHHLATLPDTASKDDVFRMKAAIRAIHPNIPASTINTVADIALRDPAGIKNGIATWRTMGISPEAMVSRVTAPPTAGGQPTTVPTTTAIRSGAMATGLSPAATAVNAGSGDAYNKSLETAGTYSNRVNPLRQAIPLLEGMKETDIGPISEKWNDIKSTAVNLGAGPLLGIDPTKIRDVNELKKYFSQYSVQAGAAMGPHTNDGLAAAVTSNPNMHMDKLSATDLSKVAMGVERMRQAGTLEFKSKVERGDADPSQFNSFLADWGTKQDPRAFVYDLMTKEQQDKLKKGLPPSELKKIREGMNIADRHGLLGDVHQ